MGRQGLEPPQVSESTTVSVDSQPSLPPTFPENQGVCETRGRTPRQNDPTLCGPVDPLPGGAPTVGDPVADPVDQPTSLLEALGVALAAAAREGRPDVVGELAAIVARVTSEARRVELERRGVPELGAGLVRVGGARFFEP